MSAEVTPSEGGGKITIVVRHNLDPELYDLPLTLKTYVPSGWESAELKQDGKSWFTGIKKDEEGRYVQYHALPNAGEIELTRVEKE